MGSSVHIDNKNKDILILGKGPIQGLDDTTLTVWAKYHINFTQSNRIFVLSPHYNASNSLLFVVATRNMSVVKAKDSEKKPFCLGNISKDFISDNMKKSRIKRECKVFFCWYPF